MTDDSQQAERRPGTKTRSFGASNRENHDASAFYARSLGAVEESEDILLNDAPDVDRIFTHTAEDMHELPANCVGLMVTSPPYHVGKDYDSDATFEEYLAMLRRVFAETYRVLEPGGRAAVNVANLGRRPYVSLSAKVVQMMEDLGYLMRGEVIWRKGKSLSGSTAWGSWMSPSNPTLRDVHEYLLVFSKGRFQRIRKGESTIDREEFLAATSSVWDLQPESANRVGHPAPFPLTLPRRCIELYTWRDDLILDPFIGSGSTAVAAVQSGRHYVGYETNPEYVAIAEKRIAEAKAPA